MVMSQEHELEILIRHPKWTVEDPRQDIPIMIFTIAQWNKLAKEEFAVSAAPIGPVELEEMHNMFLPFLLVIMLLFKLVWKKSKRL